MALGQQLLGLQCVLIQHRFSKGTLQLMNMLWLPAQRDGSAGLGQKAQQQGGLCCAPQPTPVPCRSQGRQGGDSMSHPRAHSSSSFTGIGIRVTLMSGRTVV